MRMRFLIPVAALVLSACATIQRTQDAVTRAVDMLGNVTTTVNTVLDRPAPLANTQRDEELIRSAYTRFGQAVLFIERNLVDTGIIVRNSPTALRIRRGVDIVQRMLRVARTAQQAGNAASVREALGIAQRALTGLTTDVQGSN